jgi:hypothetical protein
MKNLELRTVPSEAWTHSGRNWSASDLQDNTQLYDRTLGITVSGGIDHGATDDSGEPLLRAVIAVLAAWLRNHYMVGMGALSKDSKVVLTLLRFRMRSRTTFWTSQLRQQKRERRKNADFVRCAVADHSSR